MDMEPGKLFIGGISWDTNEDRLKEYFQVFGEVMEAVIMKDRKTGRARGFGFVVFAEPAVAERVVRERHIIDGRTVEAKKAVPRDDQHILNRNNGSLQGSPCPARTKKIFVGGLASTVTESDFKIYFDQFGTTTDVVVMYDHNTQRPRGFGFITYDSEDAVEKVLLKAFHELNGKMVEVKRAVPKELSPGPNRSLLIGYNSGMSRVSNFLNAYTQGYGTGSLGGHGGRVDGRFCPVTIGRSGYTPFGPSGYGMGSNFEPALSPRYGGNGNISSSIGYGRGFNPFYSGSPDMYSSPIGYNGRSSGTDSGNMWGNGSFNYASNSDNPNDVRATGSGSSGLGGVFGSIGTIWGSSNMSGGQVRGTDSINNSGNISYGNNGRNNGSSVAPMSSYSASGDSLGGAFRNLHGISSFYEDSTWRSSPELKGSGAFGYGGRKVASDVTANNSAGYVGGYAVTNRANRGIVT